METLYILVKVSHKKLRGKKTGASDRKKVVRLMKKKRFNSRVSESRIFGRNNDGLWHLCLTQNYLYNPEVWTVEIILNGYGKSHTYFLFGNWITDIVGPKCWTWALETFLAFAKFYIFFLQKVCCFCFVSEIIIKIDLQIFGQNNNFIFTFSYVSWKNCQW